MGARNVDRFSLRERRSKGETVADMWKERWRVRSYCESCGVRMRLNLEHVIRVNGPAFSLWDKTATCRRVLDVGGCSGTVFFEACPPGAPGYEFLGPTPRSMRPTYGPMSRGTGAFIDPADIEPAEVTAARGPPPPPGDGR